MKTPWVEGVQYLEPLYKNLAEETVPLCLSLCLSVCLSLSPFIGGFKHWLQ